MEFSFCSHIIAINGIGISLSGFYLDDITWELLIQSFHRCNVMEPFNPLFGSVNIIIQVFSNCVIT